MLAKPRLKLVDLVSHRRREKGFDDLLDFREPLFLIALEILLLGPETDEQDLLRAYLWEEGQNFQEPGLLRENWQDSFLTALMNSSFFSIFGTNSSMRANMGDSPFGYSIELGTAYSFTS